VRRDRRGECQHRPLQLFVYQEFSGSEAGSYVRLIYSCITQIKAQGPSRTCNESKDFRKRRLGVGGDGRGECGHRPLQLFVYKGVRRLLRRGQGLGFRVQGSGSRVQGPGSRI